MYHTATLRYDDDLHVFVSTDGTEYLEVELEPGELRPDLESSVRDLFGDEPEEGWLPMRIARGYLRQRGATFDTIEA